MESARRSAADAVASLDADGDGQITATEMEAAGKKLIQQIKVAAAPVVKFLKANTLACNFGIGYFMLFHGGHFPVSTQFYQTFRVTTQSTMQAKLKELGGEYEKTREQVADVPLIVMQEGKMKADVDAVSLVFMAMDQPKVLSILKDMYLCFMACVGSCMNRTLANFGVGMTVADVISTNLEKFVVSPLITVMQGKAPENEAPEAKTRRKLMRARTLTATRYIVVTASMWVSFKFEKILATWANCAIGADLIVTCGKACADYLEVGDKVEMYVVPAKTALTGWGFFSQLNGAPLPTVLAIPLFVPLQIESVLQSLVISSRGR